MGKLAVQFNRLVIVTDEDPRDESPVDIFHTICSDMTTEEQSRVVFIEDRYRAIETALSRSRPGDVLFFLGKGHEKSIMKHNHVIEWDEVDTVETLMKNIHNLHEEVS
jgi:UDP-N-acetylmuramoyl-L-alanyl-D-glutamate--2,6-diaminopimelate ligase